MRFRSISVASVLVLAACSHRTREPNAATPHDPELITATEIATVNGATVYDAVQRLRPAWILRSRPNPAQPSLRFFVFVDGHSYGSGIEALRTLPIRSAYSVEFLSATAAQARFGPGLSLGAVEVVTNPR